MKTILGHELNMGKRAVMDAARSELPRDMKIVEVSSKIASASANELLRTTAPENVRTDKSERRHLADGSNGERTDG